MDGDGRGVELTGRLLVITAVEAERQALTGLAGVDVVVGGVGPAESAAATATLLGDSTVDLVICAGIGGGLGPCSPGDLAASSRIVFADLGAETPQGYRSASQLGFGKDDYPVRAALAERVAARTGAHLGCVLTVATVTGTAAGAEELLRRYPDAVAEGMEGAGVAAAARRRGVAFAELRAISNPVGPRDRESWRIDDALRALRAGVIALSEDR